MNSPWVRREINIALNKNKFILPILHRPCTIRADLETIQIISFLTPKSYEAAFQEVLIALDHPKEFSSLPSKTKEWWVEKGNNLYGLRRYREALAAYEHAIHLDPNDGHAYNNKGAALYSLKRYEEALAAYEQAIHLDPNNAGAYNNGGAALDGLKRYKEALAAYEQAIRLDPNNARVYYNKGKTLDSLKRYKEALAAYEQAIRLDPNDDCAYYNKGKTLDSLKRYGEAFAAYDEFIRLNPGLNIDTFERGFIFSVYDPAVLVNSNDTLSPGDKARIFQRLRQIQGVLQRYMNTWQLITLTRDETQEKTSEAKT